MTPSGTPSGRRLKVPNEVSISWRERPYSHSVKPQIVQMNWPVKGSPQVLPTAGEAAPAGSQVSGPQSQLSAPNTTSPGLKFIASLHGSKGISHCGLPRTHAPTMHSFSSSVPRVCTRCWATAQQDWGSPSPMRLTLLPVSGQKREGLMGYGVP